MKILNDNSFLFVGRYQVILRSYRIADNMSPSIHRLSQVCSLPATAASRKALLQRQVQSAARPLPERNLPAVPAVQVDIADTQPVDMSPVAKQWQEYEPVNEGVPHESQGEPTRLSRRLASSNLCGSTSSPKEFVPEVPDTYLDSEPDTAMDLSDTPCVDKSVVPVGGGDENPSRKEDELETLQYTEDGQTSAEKMDDLEPDLFHTNVQVRRVDQFAERDQMIADRKNKEPDEDEDSDGPVKPKRKLTAAAKKKAAAKAKAKAKRDTKASLEKAKAKLLAATKEKEKAEKAAAQAEAKALAKASDKRKKRQGSAGESGKLNRKRGKAVEEKEHEEQATGSDAMPAGVVPAAEDEEVPDMPDVDKASNQAVAPESEDLEKKTFARRNRPSRSEPAKKIDAIRDTFNHDVKSRVRCFAKVEAFNGLQNFPPRISTARLFKTTYLLKQCWV